MTEFKYDYRERAPLIHSNMERNGISYPKGSVTTALKVEYILVTVLVKQGGACKYLRVKFIKP